MKVLDKACVNQWNMIRDWVKLLSLNTEEGGTATTDVLREGNKNSNTGEDTIHIYKLDKDNVPLVLDIFEALLLMMLGSRFQACSLVDTNSNKTFILPVTVSVMHFHEALTQDCCVTAEYKDNLARCTTEMFTREKMCVLL